MVNREYKPVERNEFDWAAAGYKDGEHRVEDPYHPYYKSTIVMSGGRVVRVFSLILTCKFANPPDNQVRIW